MKMDNLEEYLRIIDEPKYLEEFWDIKNRTKEAIELLTLMRWTRNTKELDDKVEKFIWEQRTANQQSVQDGGFICPTCKTTFRNRWLSCPNCDQAQVIPLPTKHQKPN